MSTRSKYNRDAILYMRGLMAFVKTAQSRIERIDAFQVIDDMKIRDCWFENYGLEDLEAAKEMLDRSLAKMAAVLESPEHAS